MQGFREWLTLTEDSTRTGAKLGLYPNQMDALGQYPPLYGMPSAADLITYIDIQYKGWQNVPGKGGFIKPDHEPESPARHPAKGGGKLR